MKRKWLIYLLTFSLALNGATAVAFIFFRLQSGTPAAASSGQKSITSFLLEDLNLTREQVGPILGLIDKRKQEVVALRAQMDMNRIEMINLISSVPVPKDAVEAKLDDISRIQGKIRSAAVNTVIAILESLPPESRNMFGGYLQARGRACDVCCPSGSEAGQPILDAERQGGVKKPTNR